MGLSSSSATANRHVRRRTCSFWSSRPTVLSLVFGILMTMATSTMILAVTSAEEVPVSSSRKSVRQRHTDDNSEEYNVVHPPVSSSLLRNNRGDHDERLLGRHSHTHFRENDSPHRSLKSDSSSRSPRRDRSPRSARRRSEKSEKSRKSDKSSKSDSSSSGGVKRPTQAPGTAPPVTTPPPGTPTDTPPTPSPTPADAPEPEPAPTDPPTAAPTAAPTEPVNTTAVLIDIDDSVARRHRRMMMEVLKFRNLATDGSDNAGWDDNFNGTTGNEDDFLLEDTSDDNSTDTTASDTSDTSTSTITSVIEVQISYSWGDGNQLTQTQIVELDKWTSTYVVRFDNIPEDEVITVAATGDFGSMGTTYFRAGAVEEVTVVLLPLQQAALEKNFHFVDGSLKGWKLDGPKESFAVLPHVEHVGPKTPNIFERTKQDVDTVDLYDDDDAFYDNGTWYFDDDDFYYDDGSDNATVYYDDDFYYDDGNDNTTRRRRRGRRRRTETNTSDAAFLDAMETNMVLDYDMVVSTATREGIVSASHTFFTDASLVAVRYRFVSDTIALGEPVTEMNNDYFMVSIRSPGSFSAVTEAESIIGLGRSKFDAVTGSTNWRLWELVDPMDTVQVDIIVGKAGDSEHQSHVIVDFVEELDGL